MNVTNYSLIHFMNVIGELFWNYINSFVVNCAEFNQFIVVMVFLVVIFLEVSNDVPDIHLKLITFNPSVA